MVRPPEALTRGGSVSRKHVRVKPLTPSLSTSPGSAAEQSGSSRSPSQAGPHEESGRPNLLNMFHRTICPLSACQVVIAVLASLMAVLAVVMLAGGYRALINYALHEVRKWWFEDV